MKYRYSVIYRRLEASGRVYRMTVTASDAEEARRVAAIRDPLFGSTTETPKRRAALVEVVTAERRHQPEGYFSSHPITARSVDGIYFCNTCMHRLSDEEAPEQADGMTAAKARDDLERGTAHFDREYVEWRGTEVEVTG